MKIAFITAFVSCTRKARSRVAPKRILTALVLVGCASVPFPCSAADVGKQLTPLASEALRLGFAPPADGCAVTSLSERTTGTQFIRGRPEGPLWVVELRHEDGRLVQVTSRDAPPPAPAYSDGVTRTLVWKDVPVDQEAEALAVRVTVRLDERDPRLSHWRIEAENRSRQWGIWAVHFPIVQGLGAGDDAYYVWPLNVGNKVDEPLERLPMWGPYPAASPSMQFSVVGAANAALYVATHDPQAYTKEHRFEEDGQGAAQIRLTHYPQGMGEPGRDYRLPYEVTIGVLAGDWIDACKLYRAWALDQKWCGPPLAQRDDIPQWFKDTAVWFQGSPHAKEQDYLQGRQIVDLAEFLDVPTAVHWYGWHQIPFDNSYPEYFPVKADVPIWVEKLRAAGVRTIPYINARIWDIETESYKKEQAERHAVLKPHLRLPDDVAFASYGGHQFSEKTEGERYLENWGKRTFNVMCPATPMWQQKIAGICERIVGELGMDGVYLDQTASHMVRHCFDPAHGHAIGGGHHWVSGNRELVRRCKQRMRAINPQTILTTESCAEPYSFDALLTWDGTFQAPDLAPMYHYVYSGRLVTFGRAQGHGSRAKDMQFAQCFIWGTQMGWGSWKVDSPNARYLKVLARAYADQAKRFTFYGEMLRPAATLNDVPTESVQWMKNDGRPNRRPVTMAMVVHSLWRAPDGALGLVLTNWGEDAQPIELEVPLAKLLSSVANAQAVNLTSGDTLATTVEGGRMRLKLEIPGRSARVVEIR